MTPAARVQTAIELLDRIIIATRDDGAAADTIIAQGFAERSYAGSKDRRAVRELIYAAIRRAGKRPDSGRAAMLGLAKDQTELRALFDGSPYGPATISASEPVATAGLAPAWLAEQIDPAELAALQGRAPTDLRVNTLKTTRAALLAQLDGAAPAPHAPDAIRLTQEIANLDRHPAYLTGAFEVQDAGSQLVGLATGAQPGMDVLDLCAGAGGKTLQLASMMDNRGRIIASDIDRGRLSRLLPRAERAGVNNVVTRLLNPGQERLMLADLTGQADLVLIDAPCSGSGTWRRNPEARWRLTPARLDRLLATQHQLLDLAAPLVKPGGALVYIVCSLFDSEGPAQAAAFAARQAGWRVAPLSLPAGQASGDGWRLSPALSGTDGFFIARWLAPC
jgi:16S rRNA (cytosine967-C5)-methyltransferase